MGHIYKAFCTTIWITSTSFAKIALLLFAGKENGMGKATIVLFSFLYPELKMFELHTYEMPLSMPYISRPLSFREIPYPLGAFSRLQQKPDLVMVWV